MGALVERLIHAEGDIVLGRSEVYTSDIDTINGKIESLEKFKNEEFCEYLSAVRTGMDDSLRRSDERIRADMNDKIDNDVMPCIIDNLHKIDDLTKRVCILERIVGILSVFVAVLIVFAILILAGVLIV